MSSVGLSRQIYVSSQETSTPSQFSSAFENREILSANYSLQEGTNKTAVSQWWESALVGKYSYNNTDTINVTFNGVFSSEVYINLSVGNLTLLNTTDAAADSNLILGSWRINEGGFVMSNTTSVNASLAELHANDSLSSFSSGVSLKRYGDLYFSTFFYNFTDGGQETYLVYDIDSGLMLEAVTEFGNSKLAIKLSAFAGSYFDTKTLSPIVESIQYSLLEGTNKVDSIWWSGPYTFNNTHSLNVTFLGITGENFYLNVSLGNVMRNNVTDSKADESLILGYLTGSVGGASEGGFIVDDLPLLSESFASLNEGETFTTYSSTYQEKEYGDYKFNVVTYNFTAGQETYLVYDVDSGLLLEMDSTFGKYRLAMSASVFSGSYFEERRIPEPVIPDTKYLFSPSESTIESIQYSLLEETNTSSINQWWMDGTAHSYTFSDTSSVNVTFERIVGSNFYINLSLGNLTLNNITDSSADGALILGHWKASEGGFIVGNLSLLNDSLNLLLSEETLMKYSSTLQEKKYGDYEFNVVSYNFTAGGQTTYLVYDVDSGLLLELDTSFGNYRLAMSASVFSGSYFEERRIPETNNTVTNSTVTESTVTDSTTSNIPFSLLFFFSALLLCPLFLRFSSFSKLSRKKNNES